MEIILNYYDRISYTNINSEIKYEKILTVKDDIDAFEQFYKLNNSLRYCSGSYYKFKDSNWNSKYNEWLKSDDYKSKSFNLYYGNGIVD
jgi:hypothetical protein